jgi:hypothetical protein
LRLRVKVRVRVGAKVWSTTGKPFQFVMNVLEFRVVKGRMGWVRVRV